MFRPLVPLQPSKPTALLGKPGEEGGWQPLRVAWAEALPLQPVFASAHPGWPQGGSTGCFCTSSRVLVWCLETLTHRVRQGGILSSCHFGPRSGMCETRAGAGAWASGQINAHHLRDARWGWAGNVKHSCGPGGISPAQRPGPREGQDGPPDGCWTSYRQGHPSETLGGVTRAAMTPGLSH